MESINYKIEKKGKSRKFQQIGGKEEVGRDIPGQRGLCLPGEYPL
jgi:hypothetical protein